MTLFHFREYIIYALCIYFDILIVLRLTTEPDFSTEWLMKLGNRRKLLPYI